MRRVVLFGKPLRRPHSAVMQNAAFTAFGVAARYELAEVDPGELPGLTRRARDERWLGFQVTAPYKRVIMPLLDDVEPAAREIGAVNSVEVTQDGRLIGFNTDSTGFLASLRGDLGRVPAGAAVVVAGSGGAGHAVAHAVLSGGSARLTVLDRDIASAERLAGEFASIGAIEPMRLGDPAAAERLAAADLFVNATSVGMLGKGPVVPVSDLRPDADVFDVVYIPPETELVRQARARGHRVANGAGMLVAQAAAAFTRWTGLPDPSDVMRAAVRPLLDGGVSGP
jgi:shikimate dehydrogenase